MVFNEEILNEPLGWIIDNVSNGWLRLLLTVVCWAVWVIPVILCFVLPVSLIAAFKGNY